MPPRRCFWAALALLAAPCRLLGSNAGASAPGSRTRLRGPRRATNASSALQLVQPGAASNEVVRQPARVAGQASAEDYAAPSPTTPRGRRVIGCSVAIDGDTVVVHTDLPIPTRGKPAARTRDEGATDRWPCSLAADAASATFGYSVADGDTIVAFRGDPRSASRAGGLIPHDRRRRHVRTGGQADGLRGGAAAIYFGRRSVAIVGDTVVVGAAATRWQHEPGAVYVFRTSDLAPRTARGQRDDLRYGRDFDSNHPWASTATPSRSGPTGRDVIAAYVFRTSDGGRHGAGQVAKLAGPSHWQRGLRLVRSGDTDWSLPTTGAMAQPTEPSDGGATWVAKLTAGDAAASAATPWPSTATLIVVG